MADGVMILGRGVALGVGDAMSGEMVGLADGVMILGRDVALGVGNALNVDTGRQAVRSRSDRAKYWRT